MNTAYLQIFDLNPQVHNLCLFHSHSANCALGHTLGACQDSVAVFAVISQAPTAASYRMASSRWLPTIPFHLPIEKQSTFQIAFHCAASGSAKFRLRFYFKGFLCQVSPSCFSFVLTLPCVLNWHRCCN